VARLPGLALSSLGIFDHRRRANFAAWMFFRRFCMTAILNTKRFWEVRFVTADGVWRRRVGWRRDELRRRQKTPESYFAPVLEPALPEADEALLPSEQANKKRKCDGLSLVSLAFCCIFLYFRGFWSVPSDHIEKCKMGCGDQSSLSLRSFSHHFRAEALRKLHRVPRTNQIFEG